MSNKIELEVWPSPLDIIKPRKTVPVTSACDPPDCLLALLAPRDARSGWGSSDRARLGTLVHETIDELATLRPDMIATLKSDYNAATQYLRDRCDSSGLRPGELGDGWASAIQTFNRSLQILHKFADLGRPANRRTAERAAQPASSSTSNARVSNDLTEGWAEDEAIGVHGKFDLRIVGEDTIQIDDFKTGRVDGDLEKLEKWKKQAAIYALVSWRATQGKPHSARVVAADGIFDVELSESVFETLTKELVENKRSWPRNDTSAGELCVLTPQCRSCQVRHVCPGYLSQEPWTVDESIDEESNAIWSWDVWGTMVRMSSAGNSLVILTPDGTRVIINNLPSIPASIHIGDETGLFGLRRAKNYSPKRPVLRPPTTCSNVPAPRWFKKPVYHSDDGKQLTN